MSVSTPLDSLRTGKADKGDAQTALAVGRSLARLEFADPKIRKEDLDSLQEQAKRTALNAGPPLPLHRIVADDDQKRVINATGNTIRVIAPAGSGKTQTMINRVLFKASASEPADRFLILTFDRSAASSLTSKLVDLKREYASISGSPTIQTLNAFGFGVLRSSFPKECRDVADGAQLRRFVREAKDALREINPDVAASLPPYVKDRFFLDVYSLLKNQTIDPRTECDQAITDFLLTWRSNAVLFSRPDDEESVRRTLMAIIWLFQAHDILMGEAGVIDFDDQKLRAHQCLREHGGVLRTVQSQFVEVIVDEFQDINRLDFDLIRMIAERARLVVTGDDDQAIYGFRGCSPDYIMNLNERLGRPFTSIELSTNYRCPPNIVQHADRLIRHNTRRIPKKPKAQQTNPSSIQVSATRTAGLEARWIVELIRDARRRGPELRFHDFSVLYRMNAQSLPLQIELILANMPYRVREEHNILEGEVLETLLGLLRVKLSMETQTAFRPEDGISTLRAYFRALDRRAADSLYAWFSDNQASFIDAIRAPRFASLLPKAGEGNFISTVEMLPYQTELGAVFEFVSQRFKGLKGMVASLEDALEGDEPLAEIFEVAANHPGTVRSFVDLMVRARDRARILNSGPDNRDAVDLLTYFGSKGRQWHTVVMASCNEAIIPHRRAIQDGLIEEERRLFYVGMTRASHNLVVSYQEQSCGTRVEASRFLYESGLLQR